MICIVILSLLIVDASARAKMPDALILSQNPILMQSKFYDFFSREHEWSNNCYNFATDTVTDTYAQPGTGSGRRFETINCSDVAAAALRDHLSVYSTSMYDNGTLGDCVNSWRVALAIWPAEDYHWYRYGCDGTWWHKPGSNLPRNTGTDGKLIRDPSAADRGQYSTFCGYLTVKSAKVTIR